MAKIKVGNYEPKEVSPLVNELFNKAKEIMEAETDKASSPRCWHIGWTGVSAFIEYLEESYHIIKKGGRINGKNTDL